MRSSGQMDRMGQISTRWLLKPLLRLAQLTAFIATYLALDWASFLHPLHGLNITLWNPAPALGLVLWMRYGRQMALPWFAAILIGELVVRGMPSSATTTLLLSATLTAGYGAIGEVLARRIPDGNVFGDRRRLLTWLAIVVAGTLTNSSIYIWLLSLAGLLPAGDRLEGLIRFWVGDCVGILVSMPMLWMLLTRPGQAQRRRVTGTWETAGYAALAVAVLWITFGTGVPAEFQYFYFLFLPLIWAAARQGLPGAATAAFILQSGVIIAVEWLDIVAVTVLELQMLGTVLALVGFFIGVVVDEQRLAAEKLKQTLHLAAAGEMAAALAHELNQPMTALAAYGHACEHLLARGETGPALQDAIQRMVAESGRAAEVVRRVRDFFRTGSTRLEPADIADLVATATNRFAERAAAEGVRLGTDLRTAPVLVDRLQIELVLRNLVANALDAVSARPAEERQVEVSVENVSSDGVTVAVRDSGPGLAPQAAGRLFEPFVSTKSSGLGLGLVISRAIVEAHGGRLWAEAGDGGLFRFTLPFSPKESHDAQE